MMEMGQNTDRWRRRTPTSLVSFSMNLIAFFRLLFHARNSLQYHLARRQRQFVLRRPRRCLSHRLMMIQLYGFCCRVYRRVSFCLSTRNEYLQRSDPGYCGKKRQLSIIID